MSAEPQSFENHAKLVPAFHFVTFPLVALNLLWQLYRTTADFSLDRLMTLAAALALVLIFFFARVFALKVQDRVIRLELRLRLAALAPDLGPRFDELTVNQVVALRFAGDAELPDLTRRVLAEKLDDRKTIKQQIRQWLADDWRA